MRGIKTAAMGVAAAAGMATGQPQVLVPLGDLGGEFGAVAKSVNDAREVAGYSDTQSGFQRGFYWSAATGIVGLPLLNGGHFSRANAINNQSQIVGVADNKSGQDRAVLWTKTGQVWGITDLGTLPGGLTAAANGISDTGHIVGRSGTSNGPAHACRWFQGSVIDLGVLNFNPNSGSSEALGVNGAGVSVGYAYAPLAGPDHAMRHDGTTGFDITPAGQFVFAHAVAINATGQIAAFGTVPGGGTTSNESAIYTVGGGWVELGVLPGYGQNQAAGLNNAGKVVGRMLSDATLTNVAYFYGPGGMRLLTEWASIDGEMTEATAISGNDAITLNAEDELGVSHAFLVYPDTCYINCDRSTAPPILNANDFQCFLNLFAAGTLRANCDLSTSPPVLNANDFQCFLNLFAAGCS